jgi:RNA polymerase sigma-70 factor (ECF subfamily)
LEYLPNVEILPSQTVGTAIPAELAPAAQSAISPALLAELWRMCDADSCGLTHPEFEQMVLRIGMAQNFGLAAGLAAEAMPAQQSVFFAGLRMADLVLARACAGGSERAWERFITLYREPLLRAGIAITGNETLGRELADALYAELYGLTLRDGERRCPLDSYSGRGSLIGWLRTTLAQRHVDRHRRTHREQPLDESGDCAATPEEAAPGPDHQAVSLLAQVVHEALGKEGPEEKLLLASYYLDGRKLHEIAAVLGVHEATVSRKLKRVTSALRKQIVRGLERKGMNRRQAEEALSTDPRDLTAAEHRDGAADREYLRLKELLQSSTPGPFKEQTGSTRS